MTCSSRALIRFSTSIQQPILCRTAVPSPFHRLTLPGFLPGRSEGLDKLDRCPALHHIFLKNISARLQDSGSDALQTVLKGAASGTNVSDRPESLQSVLLAAAVASPEVTQPPLCGHRFEKLHVALVGMVENLVASSGARSRDAAERMFATVCERSLVSSLTKSGKDSVRDVVDGALPAAASLIFAIVWHHVLCAVAAALRDAPLDDAEYLVDTLMEEEQGGLESLLSEQDHFAKVGWPLLPDASTVAMQLGIPATGGALLPCYVEPRTLLMARIAQYAETCRTG